MHDEESRLIDTLEDEVFGSNVNMAAKGLDLPREIVRRGVKGPKHRASLPAMERWMS